MYLRLQQLGGILADDLAGVALVEAERRGAALDLRMQADDRDAGVGGLLHRRPERAGIDEVDRDRVDALVDQVLDRLDLLVHVALAGGDDQLEAGAARGFLGAVDLAEMEGVAQIDLHQADLHLVLGKRAGRKSEKGRGRGSHCSQHRSSSLTASPWRGPFHSAVEMLPVTLPEGQSRLA